ncbi:urease accessory protein UreE [Rhizobium sp. CFBP 8762]|uniref:urease accessory protein UreE n=1 Tax=Rhizobium sp. CFBP 8762 TaxID=2775279 RepID=UPI00178035E9|nr:urease accessory protein UreE [Rhizobium sp. CFBP 8762]MBD8556598.1 urease accessory protein UreE [Rhizobium sp. CFBP 8762]
MTERCTEILKPDAPHSAPINQVVLRHDQRHLRRKLLHLINDEMVMVDLKEPVMLAHGDLLLLGNGDCVEVAAAEEQLYEITPRNALHLIELAWHLGNRHLPAEIQDNRILIQRDPVIQTMLAGLGAGVREVTARFQPVRGAYHTHGGHAHHHG